jgi:hypothetical protein
LHGLAGLPKAFESAGTKCGIVLVLGSALTRWIFQIQAKPKLYYRMQSSLAGVTPNIGLIEGLGGSLCAFIWTPT